MEFLVLAFFVFALMDFVNSTRLRAQNSRLTRARAQQALLRYGGSARRGAIISRSKVAGMRPEDCNGVELAVRGAQSIELVLKEDYGAEGKGLHEFISSKEDQFDQGLVKRMRWIASVRNNVVHNHASIDDPADFHAAVVDVLLQIDKKTDYSQPGPLDRWIDIHILKPIPLERDLAMSPMIAWIPALILSVILFGPALMIVGVFDPIAVQSGVGTIIGPGLFISIWWLFTRISLRHGKTPSRKWS